uniref:Uncharacterized protein n=1 Tax=Amphiprion percula TaxID=161767 RepID=A0A3P8RNL0_AMPPE
MSPSSGYSSQSGTPTLSPKGISPTSPDKQKKKPVKPERSVSRASSSAASPSSSLTSLSSGTSELANADVPPCSPNPPPQGSPPTSPSTLPTSTQASDPSTVPTAPALPAENLTHGVNFRRQPSVGHRDARSKELLSRHKSAPIPKEDANIPLVTPSLLQMVRLRSGAPVQENCPVSIQGPQNIPQKPIRKSLSMKSPPQAIKTSSVTMNSPSMRLQEAIRMKTAAMSSRDGAVSLKLPEGCDMHKSPASTASFIFSRSTKKVVIETAAASSPEAQASLKQSLAAELMQVSDQSKAAAFSNGEVKCDRVPPPVAKKPAHGSVSPSQNLSSCSAKMEHCVERNGTVGVQQMSGVTPPETLSKCRNHDLPSLSSLK